MINVRNQLVGSPFDKDVEIECNVEASPRSINYWIKDIKDGELNIYILLIIMFSDCIGKCLLHAISMDENTKKKIKKIKRFKDYRSVIAIRIGAPLKLTLFLSYTKLCFSHYIYSS